MGQGLLAAGIKVAVQLVEGPLLIGRTEAAYGS
jgi:hypothetical protein